MSKVVYKFNPETLSFDRESSKSGSKRILFLFVIICAILYFIIGYLLVIFGKFPLNNFLTVSAIVGGIASVSGLFTFFNNRIRRSDIEEIGLEYFEDVIKSAEQLKEKQKDLKKQDSLLSEKERQLKKLELNRVELEYIVRKASMNIFLQDQLERLENQIVELLNENKELSNLFGRREHLKAQLLELDEEIKLNKSTEKVQEIIEMIQSTRIPQKKEKTFAELVIDSFSYFTKLLPH